MMLRFAVGKIPVRVHGSFLFLALLLGAMGGTSDPSYLALWVAIVFVGVLLHELGHALTAKAFGMAPSIDLHGMGGLTSWGGDPLSHGKRILTTAAGPAVGLVIGFSLVAMRRAGVFDPISPQLDRALDAAIFVNAGWAVLNLLPILPLDGGSILQSTIDAVTKNRGELPTRVISVITAAGATAAALVVGSIWGALLAGSLAVRNVQGIMVSRAVARDRELLPALNEAVARLEKGEFEAAKEHVREVVRDARSEGVRTQAHRVLGFAHLGAGDFDGFVRLLDGAPARIFSRDELTQFEEEATRRGHHAAADALRTQREKLRKMGL
jgi:Zn-dependent protease